MSVLPRLYQLFLSPVGLEPDFQLLANECQFTDFLGGGSHCQFQAGASYSFTVGR